MNQMEIFKNPEFGSIRVIEENGKYLFCGTDVAAALGYSNSRDAIFSTYFPTKKSVAFRPYLLVHILQYTARGCQSLVPCFSLISWSCTRILFFLSTTALGCAFNVLLHACTVAPNAVTAFIIRCHRSHVNPFTRPKNDFFV